jgi:tetratricopeptide (TPR) repeat protein
LKRRGYQAGTAHRGNLASGGGPLILCADEQSEGIQALQELTPLTPDASADLPPDSKRANGSGNPQPLPNVPPGKAGRPEATTLVQGATPPVGPGAEVKTLIQAEPPATDRPGWPTIPGYEILKELGRGGMGVVYWVWQPALKRTAALKMILSREHAGSEELKRFRTEAEAAARLQHPNINQIYEIGELSGQPYFTLEYVDGGNLSERLGGTPMPAAEAARLVEKLARAMQYAHLRGILHRDLKPENVLLTADGEPKITDFGLAKFLTGLRPSQTRTGEVLGTPSYMPPEQAQGRIQALTVLVDVYALGAILYDTLTGRPPFRADTTIETLRQVILEEPVAPRHLQPKVPRDLETVCLKCLQKNPRRRYASAADLADDLQRFLVGQPITARPVRPWERAYKWARRRPAAALLVVLLLVSLCGGVGLYLWFDASYKASLQTQIAEQTAELKRINAEQQQQEDRARLDRLREQVRGLATLGQRAVAKKDWENADKYFTAALERIGPTGTPEVLGELADSLRQQQQRLVQARGRFKKFKEHRDDALFHETLRTGLDREANRKKTEEAARKALDQFGIQPDAQTPPPLPSVYLSADEHEEVGEGCYEMLLVLAEAVAPSSAGPDRAERALRVLDLAAKLGRPASRAYYLRRARYLQERDGPEAGRAERQQAETTRPAGALDHFLTGQEWFKQGAMAQAAREFENALRARPDHFWAQYFLAVSYLNLQRPELAKGHLTACLTAGLNQQQTPLPWIYLLRGLAHAELREFTDAAEDYEKAKDHPDDVVRYSVHVNRGALRFREAQALEPASSLDQPFALVLTWDLGQVCAGAAKVTRERKLAQAVADLRAAVDAKPQEYQAYLNLATAYEKLGKLQDAVAELDKAIRMEQNLPELYQARARLLLRDDLTAAQKDLASASRLVKERKARSEGLAADYLACGYLHLKNENYPDAWKACDAAFQAYPDYLPAYVLRGRVLLKRDRYQEAARAFDEYINRARYMEAPRSIDERLRRDRNAAEAFRERAQARQKLKNYHSALEDYNRALELALDSATLAQRGWLLLLAFNSPQLALADFEEAIRRGGKLGDAHNGRGYALVLLGRYQEAVEDAQTAVKLGPPEPRQFYNSARIYAQAVARVSADGRQRSSYQTALALDYQDHALNLLSQALAAVPREKRAQFWHDYVEEDKGLHPIRRDLMFAQLAAQYGRPSK